MGFVECDKTKKDLLIGLHQDMLSNNFSVHDETVQVVDKYLSEPIMRNMVKLVELDKIFSQVNLPFIQFKFDLSPCLRRHNS